MRNFTKAIVGIVLAGGAALPAYAQQQLTLSSSDPANGAKINTFTGVTVTFGDKKFKDVTAVKNITYSVMNPASDDMAQMGSELTAELLNDGQSIYLGFSDAAIAEMREADIWPIKTPGTYSIHIEEGALQMTGDENTVYTNAETVISYQLIPAATYTLTPDPSRPYYSIDKFTLSFDDFEQMDVTGSFKFSLTGPDGEVSCLGQMDPGYTSMVIVPQPEIITPGQYRFLLKAGSLILVGGNGRPNQVNPEIDVIYTVEEAPDFGYTSISPKPGIIDFMASVRIVYTSVPSANKDCKEPAVLTHNGKTIAELYNNSPYLQWASDQDPSTTCYYVFVNNLKDAYREPGKYVLTVPEGYLNFSNGTTSPLQVYEYDIPTRFAYTLSPKEGTVENFDHVDITFNGATKVTQNELPADSDSIRVVCWTAEEDIYPEVSINGATVTLSFPEQTSRCQYAVDIPYGAFTIHTPEETGNNQSINAIYYIPTIPRPAITPAEGEVTSDNLHEITLTLQEGTTFDIWFLTSTPYISAVKDGEILDGALAIFKRSNDISSYKGKNSITLYQNQPYRDLADGDYVIRLNKSTFSVKGADEGWNNCGYEWYYTVKNESGVEEMLRDNDTVTVYTIDGRCLLRGANATMLRNLDKGLYIVNGKKYLLR